MHLKTLTLRGFKSFASATTLGFEPGVTCVVGPNGSGKSNVVDALAWVMGEQGAKSLRGGKMEDVIFAGTAGRPPLGRAEVSLTIDNSDGALPIEYSEVTISRTLFRNGGSEYAINGEACRLLDIQELLSDSGLGREMHVIVGQGQLDAVLRATPEERRGFIEEAAGVLKHRKRKEKALRKLEAMQANLTRLQDLTGEIRRQLKPLGRQAEVARKAAVVQADLRDARARLLADDLRAADRHARAGDRRRDAPCAPRRDRGRGGARRGPRAAGRARARGRRGRARAERGQRGLVPAVVAARAAARHRLPGRRAACGCSAAPEPERDRRVATPTTSPRRPSACAPRRPSSPPRSSWPAVALEAAVDRPPAGRGRGRPPPRRSVATALRGRRRPPRGPGPAGRPGRRPPQPGRGHAGRDRPARAESLAAAEQRGAGGARPQFAALETQVAGVEEGEEGLDAEHEAAAEALDAAERAARRAAGGAARRRARAGRPGRPAPRRSSWA